MLILTCPCCHVTAEETEFHAGGEAHLTRIGPEGSEGDFESYLFMRQNPKGVHLERWRHVYGCGKWFHLARDTATLQVYGAYSAQTTAPPDHIRNAIKDRHPDWRWQGEAEQ